MAWTNPRTWVTDELVTASIMNTHVRDNLNAVKSIRVRKPSDETVTSSVTYQADDHLLLAVGANEVWTFEFRLLVDAGPGGFQGRLAFPAGGYLSVTQFNPISNAWASNVANTSPRNLGTWASATAGDRHFSMVWGVFVNGGTAGNLALEWTQGSSNATATIVKTNSGLWAAKIN